MDVNRRQPVHVVYGGAQLFTAETLPKVAKIALKSLHENAPTAEEFNRCLGLDPHAKIYDRVVRKLQTEAVEDFRIDFEDGYGNRSDEEEDADATRTAKELAAARKNSAIPPFVGIRVKSLSGECRARSLRTLDLFIRAWVKEAGNTLPSGFVVTLPKVESSGQASYFAGALSALEKAVNLAPDSLRFEVMVESPPLLLNKDGVSELPKLIEASRGRLVAAHFGAYDFTAACDVTASCQSLTHPACDFARQMMKMAFSGTSVWLSDGATNIMPIGPHRAKAGEALNPAELEENRSTVHQAWKKSFSDIRNSLHQGFYQGWDLHPAQIPVRYAAVFSFFQESREAASDRLKGFIQKAAQASLVGNVFDDAASGQGLLNYFLRGLNCGALTEQEVLGTGLTLEELCQKSFLRIAQARRLSRSAKRTRQNDS